MICDTSRDFEFMGQALDLAQKAAEGGEVPVGALLVRAGEVVAAAGNQREQLVDPTAHAEILALRLASERLGRWRLSDCTLYVTLEPCPMCAGALWAARIGGLVFGAADPKAGAAGSLYNLSHDERLNHRFEVREGVRSEECGQLLQEFFKKRRRAEAAYRVMTALDS